MTTAIDTNIIVALWDPDKVLSSTVQTALDAALERGSLIIAAPVFAELMAAPGRTESFLNSFFTDTSIVIDWILDEAIWRAAGRAFQAYTVRRSKQSGPGPRRILADFLIGAHAQALGYTLLTLDGRLYRAAFPDLSMVTV